MAEDAAAEEEWNFLAPSYIDNLREPINQHIPHVLELLEGRNVSSILDIGCGSGDLCNALQNKFPSACVHGLDICKAMIDYAIKHRASSNMIFHHAAWPNLPSDLAGDKKFDLIVCSFTLMYLKEPAARLAEMKARLAPGGAIVVSCWGLSSENPWLSLPQALIGSQEPLPTDATLLYQQSVDNPSFCLGTIEKLKKLMSDTGLSTNVKKVNLDMEFSSGDVGAVEQVLRFFSFMPTEKQDAFRLICNGIGIPPGKTSRTFPAGFVLAMGENV